MSHYALLYPVLAAAAAHFSLWRALFVLAFHSHKHDKDTLKRSHLMGKVSEIYGGKLKKINNLITIKKSDFGNVSLCLRQMIAREMTKDIIAMTASLTRLPKLNKYLPKQSLQAQLALPLLLR